MAEPSGAAYAAAGRLVAAASIRLAEQGALEATDAAAARVLAAAYLRIEAEAAAAAHQSKA